MTGDTNPQLPSSATLSFVLDPAVLASHLVAVFNERALGTIVGWSVGTWLRSETVRSLQSRLEQLSSVVVHGTVDLGFVHELASVAGVAKAVGCSAGDDDVGANEIVANLAEGADVLLAYLTEAESRWVEPEVSARTRLLEHLGERLAAAAAIDLDDGAEGAAEELARCTAAVAALVVHGAWLGFDARAFGIRREVTPICPVCGTATTLNQGMAGWAALTGVDPNSRGVSVGETVVAECYEVTCRDCGNDFSEREVVEASIAFDKKAAARQV